MLVFGYGVTVDRIKESIFDTTIYNNLMTYCFTTLF